MTQVPPPQPLPAPRQAEGMNRFTVGRWFAAGGGALVLILLVGIALSVNALNQLGTTRDQVVEVIDPALMRSLELTSALTGQDTAIRAYGLTGERGRFDEYQAAVAAERRAAADLTRHLRELPGGDRLAGHVGRITAAAREWREEYAERVAEQVREKGEYPISRSGGTRGVELFTGVRASLAPLQGELERLHREGVARMQSGARTLYLTLGALAVIVLVTLVVLALLIRRFVLNPVSRLTEQVRTVAGGDFDARIGVDRPAELNELSGHIDAMRGRILAEWRRVAEAQAKLEDQALELRRSNGELEQFAYVASHDLQEPLRKVASFTQMLEQRYGDQLDDRAKQYIAYAVDGAKRMQTLINDLLAFSRVGRVGGERQMTDSGAALRAALDNLAAPIEEADATVVVHTEMPQVYGNGMLLTQLFQNLVSNAVKFRSSAPPIVEIAAERRDDMWEFSCSDNGIGIDSKYAERVFMIFQRLHPRDVYPGTGIGLALAKKIVEYLGGTIWVDNVGRTSSGTTFRWTLPAAPPLSLELTPHSRSRPPTGAASGADDV